jgi:hypothetical protein
MAFLSRPHNTMYTSFGRFNDLQLRPCFAIIGHSRKEILAHILSSEKFQA